jgi:ABC-2 type transport system ATP-binding protein
MLELDSLKKRFGGKPALEGVSFQVEQGEIYGLLGHNGAGKSTTLGIILGMVAPDSGEARIGGVSVQRKRAAALRSVGSIFESPCFYEYLSGWENLRILSSYSGPFDKAAAEDAVGRVGLTERIGSKVRTYSHGMRQRLALAQALLPMPKVLLLDEPTDGLDPEGIKWFRDFILGLRRERGMTVLFNSHLLAEVEQMCDRVAILKQGKRVFEGKVSSLRSDERVFEIDVDPWPKAAEFLELQGCQIISPGRVMMPHAVDPAVMVAALVGLEIRVSAFSPVRHSLEDLYLEITR